MFPLLSFFAPSLPSLLQKKKKEKICLSSQLYFTWFVGCYYLISIAFLIRAHQPDFVVAVIVVSFCAVEMTEFIIRFRLRIVTMSRGAAGYVALR